MPRVRPVHTSTLAPADTEPPSEPATAPTTRTQTQQHQQAHTRNNGTTILRLTCEDMNNATESTRPSSTRTLPELCVRSIRYHSCDHVLPAQFAPTDAEPPRGANSSNNNTTLSCARILRSHTRLHWRRSSSMTLDGGQGGASTKSARSSTKFAKALDKSSEGLHQSHETETQPVSDESPPLPPLIRSTKCWTNCPAQRFSREI